MADHEVLHIGSVKWYNTDKGYGFIVAQGVDKDIFLHIKQLRASGIDGSLFDGEQVQFVCNKGPKGLFATNIVRVNGGIANANKRTDAKASSSHRDAQV